MLLPHPPCRGMGALYKRALEASWSITDRTAPVPLVVSPAVEFPLYLEPTVTMSSGGVPTSGKVSPPSYLDCPCIAGVVAGDITVPGWTIALTIFFIGSLSVQRARHVIPPHNPPSTPASITPAIVDPRLSARPVAPRNRALSRVDCLNIHHHPLPTH